MRLAEAATPGDLSAARAQTGFSLAWHIVVACLGVGLPLLTLTAEWLGIFFIPFVLGAVLTPFQLVVGDWAARFVALILWAWGVAQYPVMLVPDVTVADAASHGSVLTACLVSPAVGAVFLVPSLWWLYSLFQSEGPSGKDSRPANK